MTNTERAQVALVEACKELGLQPSVKIVEIKGERWILNYEQDLNYPRFDYAMIKLERVLREVTRSKVELMLEALTDKNKRDQKSGRLVSARNVDSLDS